MTNRNKDWTVPRTMQALRTSSSPAQRKQKSNIGASVKLNEAQQAGPFTGKNTPTKEVGSGWAGKVCSQIGHNISRQPAPSDNLPPATTCPQRQPAPSDNLPPATTCPQRCVNAATAGQSASRWLSVTNTVYRLATWRRSAASRGSEEHR